MTKKIFLIEGMHCTSCAKLIETELQNKVNSIKVDFERGKAFIDFDVDKISETRIKNIISKMGYKVI